MYNDSMLLTQPQMMTQKSTCTTCMPQFVSLAEVNGFRRKKIKDRFRRIKIG